ncbi:MAG: hypothetical protein ARM1_0597 [Candidatus Micrarchaeota archaeon]|nr:MAG: hypothetical protein ARM1_0597 [Candidatus Micrarchaeota archaeon]
MPDLSIEANSLLLNYIKHERYKNGLYDEYSIDMLKLLLSMPYIEEYKEIVSSDSFIRLISAKSYAGLYIYNIIRSKNKERLLNKELLELLNSIDEISDMDLIDEALQLISRSKKAFKYLIEDKRLKGLFNNKAIALYLFKLANRSSKDLSYSLIKGIMDLKAMNIEDSVVYDIIDIYYSSDARSSDIKKLIGLERAFNKDIYKEILRSIRRSKNLSIIRVFDIARYKDILESTVDMDLWIDTLINAKADDKELIDTISEYIRRDPKKYKRFIPLDTVNRDLISNIKEIIYRYGVNDNIISKISELSLISLYSRLMLNSIISLDKGLLLATENEYNKAIKHIINDLLMRRLEIYNPLHYGVLKGYPEFKDIFSKEQLYALLYGALRHSNADIGYLLIHKDDLAIIDYKCIGCKGLELRGKDNDYILNKVAELLLILNGTKDKDLCKSVERAREQYRSLRLPIDKAVADLCSVRKELINGATVEATISNLYKDLLAKRASPLNAIEILNAISDKYNKRNLKAFIDEFIKINELYSLMPTDLIVAYRYKTKYSIFDIKGKISSCVFYPNGIYAYASIDYLKDSSVYLIGFSRVKTFRYNKHIDDSIIKELDGADAVAIAFKADVISDSIRKQILIVDSFESSIYNLDLFKDNTDIIIRSLYKLTRDLNLDALYFFGYPQGKVARDIVDILRSKINTREERLKILDQYKDLFLEALNYNKENGYVDLLRVDDKSIRDIGRF